MTLDLKRIFAEDGAVLPISHELDLSDLEFSGVLPLKKPVNVKGSVSNKADMVVLDLLISYTYDGYCDRCGIEASHDYAVTFNRALAVSIEGEDSDTIITIPDMKLFVYDYDHNAPTAEHLWKTHEAFFKKIREAHPDMPILMLTRPDFDYDPQSEDRINAIRTTYENALKNGDKNVYFISGKEYFGEKDRTLCLVDTTHPNDLGFYKMAETIYPVMKKMLGID